MPYDRISCLMHTIFFRVPKDNSQAFKKIVLAIFWEDDGSQLHKNLSYKSKDDDEYIFMTTSDKDLSTIEAIGNALCALVKVG